VNLDLSTIQTSAPWVLIAIAVLGLVLAIVIKKIIGKIIVLVLAAVIVFVGWQQRAKVVDFANNLQTSACTSHPTFFGIQIIYPGCPTTVKS
jgi:4-hydroxybenzoate polyprenyltransferase